MCWTLFYINLGGWWEKKTSGMLSLKRGAGGGASETDGGGQQQVQASHHHRRTLKKGVIIHSMKPFSEGLNPREMIPIEIEQNCEIGNKIFQSLLGMDAIFVLSVQTDVSPQANYKINAMKIMFDLHTFKQKKVYQNMRAEQEKSVRYFLFL